MSNQTIALQVGLHYMYVAVRRKHFFTLYFEREIVAGVPERLEDKIYLLLSHRKRSGTPHVFTQKQLRALIVLA